MLTPNQVSINYFMNQLNIQLKVCSKCKESLPVDKFHKDSRMKDGLHSYCKSCNAEYDKLRYQNNPDKIKTENKANRERYKSINLEREKTTYFEDIKDNPKRCSCCKQTKTCADFNRNITAPDGLQNKCKSCRTEYYQDNPDKFKAENKAYAERNKVINLEREKTTYFEDIKDNPKRCSCCKQTKTCADFSRCITTKDGLNGECKDCNTKSSIERIVNKEKDDPNFKLVRRFQQAFSIALKQGEVIPALKKLMKKAGIKSIQELMGVKTIQIARKMLLKTIPQGYTKQDWVDQSLHIDHREPLSYFLRLHGDNLKLALIQANQITNLRLIEAKENLRKNSSYALMPDNTELIYEDWVKTKAVEINE